MAEDEVKVEQSTRGRALTEFAEALDALRPVVGNWADVLRRIKGLYQEEKARALTNGTAPPTDPPTSTDTLSRAASPNRLIAAGRPPSAPTVEWIARATGADVALFADWRARLERYCTATDEERANINPFLEPRAKPIETDEAIAGASSRPLAGRSGDFPQPGSTVVGESNLARGGRKWLLGAVGAGGVVAVAVAVTLVVSSGHSSDLSAGSGMSTAASSAGAVAGAAHAVLTSRSRLSSSSVLTDPASGPLIVGNAWAMQRGCAGTTALAMPTGQGGIESFHGDESKDIREVLLAAGAGAWKEGNLELTLSAAAGQSISVKSVNPKVIRTDLPAPIWVQWPIADCGGGRPPTRTFALALDVPTMVDTGLANAGAAVEGHDYTRVDRGVADLGSNFTLSGATQGSMSSRSTG